MVAVLRSQNLQPKLDWADRADGGQRPGDPGGWADVVRIAVLRLPDERLQLLPASRAELHERER
jgi:hypothetical protein